MHRPTSSLQPGPALARHCSFAGCCSGGGARGGLAGRVRRITDGYLSALLPPAHAVHTYAAAVRGRLRMDSPLRRSWPGRPGTPRSTCRPLPGSRGGSNLPALLARSAARPRRQQEAGLGAPGTRSSSPPAAPPRRPVGSPPNPHHCIGIRQDITHGNFSAAPASHVATAYSAPRRLTDIIPAKEHHQCKARPGPACRVLGINTPEVPIPSESWSSRPAVQRKQALRAGYWSSSTPRLDSRVHGITLHQHTHRAG